MPESQTADDTARTELDYMSSDKADEAAHREEKGSIMPSLRGQQPAVAQTRTWPEPRDQASAAARLAACTLETPTMTSSTTDGNNRLDSVLHTPATAFVRDSNGFKADLPRGVPPPSSRSMPRWNGPGSDERRMDDCSAKAHLDDEDGVDIYEMLRHSPAQAKKVSGARTVV